MRKIIFVLAISLYMVGCAQHTFTPIPTSTFTFKDFPAQAKAEVPSSDADYGSYPTNYKDLVKKHFNETLRDPDSAKYSEWSEPKKTYYMETKLSKPQYSYSVDVVMNAKNAYGGYVGNRLYIFFIKNGKIESEHKKNVLRYQAFLFGYEE